MVNRTVNGKYVRRMAEETRIACTFNGCALVVIQREVARLQGPSIDPYLRLGRVQATEGRDWVQESSAPVC